MVGTLARVPIVDDDAGLARILAETRTIALVGASPHPWRDSHAIMAYLQQQGFRVIPVNPNARDTRILGESVFDDLASIGVPVEMVNVFRNSDRAAEAIDAAIASKNTLGVRSVWLQLGVCNVAATERACNAGLEMIVDRCIKIEHRRLRQRSSAKDTTGRQ